MRNSSSNARVADLVGLEHREADVAVAGVAAAGDPGAVGVGDLLHLGHELGDGAAGHSDVDDVIRVVGLATQNAFSRASISWVAAPGGRTYTSVAPSEWSSSETADVLVEAVVVGALHHHHEVGQRRRLHVLRDPQLQAELRLHGRQREHVDVLEYRRAEPAGGHPRHGGVATSSNVGKGASTVAEHAGRGVSFRVASVTRARVPSEPMMS